MSGRSAVVPQAVIAPVAVPPFAEPHAARRRPRAAVVTTVTKTWVVRWRGRPCSASCEMRVITVLLRVRIVWRSRGPGGHSVAAGGCALWWDGVSRIRASGFMVGGCARWWGRSRFSEQGLVQGFVQGRNIGAASKRRGGNGRVRGGTGSGRSYQSPRCVGGRLAVGGYVSTMERNHGS